MMTTTVFAVSKDTAALEDIAEHVRETFEKKGIRGRVSSVFSAHVMDFKSVIIEGKDPSEGTHPLIAEIFRSTFDAANHHTTGPEISFIRIEWETPIQFEFDDFRKHVPTHDGVYLQKSTRTHTHEAKGTVPFSYDPALEYYTEVDTY